MKLRLNLQIRSISVIALLLFLALGLNTAVLTYIALDKYRQVLNAATMLNMSKTPHQAEIDSACEAKPA